MTLLGYDFAPAADPAKLLEQTYTETSAAVSGIYVQASHDFTALFTYVAGDGTKLEKTLNVEVREDADAIPTLYSTNSAATYSRPTPSVTSGKITSIQQVSGTWLIWFNGEDAYCCDNGKKGRPAGCPTYNYTHTSTVDATQYVPGDHYVNQMRIWGGLDQLSMGLLTVRESDDFSEEFCVRYSSTYSASDAAVLEYAARIYNEQQLYQDIKQLLKGRSELYDVKRAAAFFRLIYYSFRSSGKSYGGQGGDLFSMVDVLLKCSRRLAKVRIQNMDFEKLILQYDHPDTVFYLDPPYYKTEKMYDVTFGEGDHQRLQKVLSSIQGRYLLSYNDSPYIRDLYSGPGLRIVGKKRPNTYSGVKDAIFEELFIMNYNPGADSMKPAQLSLEEIV